jgi:toxin YhaV
VIPQDPTRPECRQGSTLGEQEKHWFRAKFFQKYRLFFRYHAPSQAKPSQAKPSQVLVLAWVNDEDTKRADDSGGDAYRVLQNMLANGQPPGDWDGLLREAMSDGGAPPKIQRSRRPKR